VARINAQGEVTYRATGTVTITATARIDNVNMTESIVLTIINTTPKLPVSTITLYTSSSVDTLITVLPSDIAPFDNIEIISNNPRGLAINKIDETTYRIRHTGTPAPANGRVNLDLQAKNGSENVGGTFRLTVNVVTGMPRATLRMDRLNTFWKDAESPIRITGTNLPEIKEIRLVDSTTATHGRVSENFRIIGPGNSGSWIITAAEKFTSFIDTANTRPAVRGSIEIHYEGFSVPQVISNFTVPIRAVAPRPTVSPATQLISTHESSLNNETATFHLANAGAGIDEVTKADNTATAKNVNRVIDNIASTDNSFTVTMNKDITSGWKEHNGNYLLRLNVLLEGARNPIPVSVRVRTTRNALTTAQQTPRVTVRAVGNINLMDRENTARTYVPTLSNSPFAVLDGMNVTFFGRDASRASQVLNIEMINGNAVVTAKTDSDINRGERFNVQLQFRLTDGRTVDTAAFNISPAQSAVRHSLPRQAMYQSRTGTQHREIIDLSPTSPIGARVASLEFKIETEANERNNRQVNNPNGAYWFHFDEENQQLHVWIRDSSRVRLGRYNLVFSVTYEGQGLEQSGTRVGQARLIDLRLPVNVLR
jgi:hypothetical protein